MAVTRELHFEVDGIEYRHPHLDDDIPGPEVTRAMIDVIEDHEFQANCYFCGTGIYSRNDVGE